MKYLTILFFLTTIILLIMYFTKSPKIIETKIIYKDDPCPYSQLSYSRKIQCDASEACKKQNGRLKNFKDTFGNAPEFECEYNK